MLTDNLISYWSFSEGSGTTLHDSVGTLDLTLEGNYSWVDGYKNKAINFVYSGGRAKSTSGLNLDGIVTVNMIVKLTQVLNKQQRVIDLNKASVIIELTSSFGTGDNKLHVNVYYEGAYCATTFSWTQNTQMSDYVMVTVVLTTTQSEVKIYVNGVEQTSKTGGARIGTIINGAISIGDDMSNTNVGTNGIINHVGLWDRILSPNDIETIYNGGDILVWPFAVAQNKAGILNFFK